MAAKYEAEELMNSILVVAHQMLREYREFYPYGGYMDRDGGIRHVAVKDPDTDHPNSQDMIETLESTFREMAREKTCRAAGIVCDVRLKSPDGSTKRDAIQVSLDHMDNYSVKVFFPYSFVNDQLVFGEAFTTRGEDRIFGDEQA